MQVVSEKLLLLDMLQRIGRRILLEGLLSDRLFLLYSAAGVATQRSPGSFVAWVMAAEAFGMGPTKF